MPSLDGLLIVVAVAFAAPFALGLAPALRMEEAALFEQHVNFCDGCDWYVDQMRTTIATVGRIEETDVPPELRDRLLAAFRDRGGS